MAQQLVDVLGITETQATNLLQMTGNDVHKAMNLYLSTQSSPAGGSTAAPVASAASAPAPVPPPAVEAEAEAPAASASPKLEIAPGGKMIRLRVQSSTGMHDLKVDEHTPVAMFQMDIAEQVGVEAECMRLLGGFPPKPISTDDGTATLKDLGVCNGDKLTVQKGEAKEMVQGKTKGKYIPPSETKGSFTRREMPADNSCMFHACRYVLMGKSRGEASEMRKAIADVVMANPGKYTTAFLGQPNASYASWIQQKDNWGGAIELSILSFLHQTEIVALDLISKRMYRYGEDEEYSTRCFLLYSGRHYDAMAMASYGGAAESSSDQVLFSSTDNSVFKKANDLLESEHAKALADPQGH